VQRLFLGDNCVAVGCSLKHIIQPNPGEVQGRKRLNFRFALTGSGTVTAFRAFAAMPANGSRFLGNCKLLSLAKPVSHEVLAAVRADLANILPNTASNHTLISIDAHPALLCFYADCQESGSLLTLNWLSKTQV